MAGKVKRKTTNYKNIYYNENTQKYDVKYNFKEYDVKAGRNRYRAKWIYNLSTITLQYCEINLTRLLEQLVYEFQPIFEKKGLICRLVAEDDMILNCDADKMQRVFDNLLRNAVVYSYDGTEIIIQAKGDQEGLILNVSNYGETIPGEKLERIFEQFYRLDTGRGTTGAGLGLAIAKQIVTLHKGTITAASENGLTTFTVTLPAL